MKKFVQVGRVKDAHGLKGELFITLKGGEAAWLRKLKELRLTPAGAADPKIFPVKSTRAHKNGIIVLSPAITNRNDAEALIGSSFEVPAEFLVSAKGEEPYLIEIQNFKVDVKGRGEIGSIIGFSSNTAQDLLIVKTTDGEFEIPFVKAFVVNIDFEGKVVHMDLPEGLLGELEDEDLVRDDQNDADGDE